MTSQKNRVNKKKNKKKLNLDLRNIRAIQIFSMKKVQVKKNLIEQAPLEEKKTIIIKTPMWLIQMIQVKSKVPMRYTKSSNVG